MIGIVDESGRALLRVRLRSRGSSTASEIEAWIDTGFTGELVLPRNQAVSLGLEPCSGTQAILADGSKITVDAYTCEVLWFGVWKEAEVIANNGRFPLLGVGLLRERDLNINYQTKTVSIV